MYIKISATKCTKFDTRWTTLLSVNRPMWTCFFSVLRRCYVIYDVELLYIQGNLRRHVQSINIKVKYNCESCEYKASTKGSLWKHDSLNRPVARIFSGRAQNFFHADMSFIFLVCTIIVGKNFLFLGWFCNMVMFWS